MLALVTGPGRNLLLEVFLVAKWVQLDVAGVALYGNGGEWIETNATIFHLIIMTKQKSSQKF